MSPRVVDYYKALLHKVIGTKEEYNAFFSETADEIKRREESGDLDIFFSGEKEWKFKLDRIKKRALPFLKGARSLDRRTGKTMDDDVKEWRQKQLKNASDTPHGVSNESQPGVDPMERLEEGEWSPSIWSINPPWGGYYKERSYSEWDEDEKKWRQTGHEYKEARPTILSRHRTAKGGAVEIVLGAHIKPHEWISLPIPYTHSFSIIEADGEKVIVKQDQFGDLVFKVKSKESVDVKITLVPDEKKCFTHEGDRALKCPVFRSTFSEETVKKLDEIRKSGKSGIEMARNLKIFVLSTTRYIKPKDINESEYYNNYYRTHKNGFAGAVDEIKKGDCDVINTYYAALCSELGIATRHCVGHMVNNKNDKGGASINSGSGHAWTEVWNGLDGKWDRIDATPAGDPNMEDQNSLEGDSKMVGDYGEQPQQNADELIEKLKKKLLDHKEEVSYTLEEREMARASGVEMSEARKIIREIKEVELLRLPNGERISDVLYSLFKSIIQSRKAIMAVYDGPVRKREGGRRIKHLVRHVIATKAGESDPMTRELEKDEEKQEELQSGMDLYLIGDKSGSMCSLEGEQSLWKMQRKAAYLILNSLHRFSKEVKKSGLSADNTLSIRSQCLTFRGQKPEQLDLDKPLTDDFSDQDKVRMWHSMGKEFGSNGEVEALKQVFAQIVNEVDEKKLLGLKDNKLRLVIMCSDGQFVGGEEVVKKMLEDMGEMNVVIVGIGLGKEAKAVKVLFNNPPNSHGEVAEDLSVLPGILAKYVVGQAFRLYPEKKGKNTDALIKKINKMFNF